MKLIHFKFEFLQLKAIYYKFEKCIDKLQVFAQTLPHCEENTGLHVWRICVHRKKLEL